MIDREALIVNFCNKQKEFPILLSINYFREFDELGCVVGNLGVILGKDLLNPDGEKLHLLFKDVRDLKFEDLGRPVQLCVQITNITDCQIEGIHYYAEEEHSFSLYCKVFDYKVK